MARSLTRRGFEIVEFGEAADLIVINTCTVTEQADQKCRQAVRQALRRNPDTYVAVVGCYAQSGVDAIRKIDGVDLVVGNEHKLRVGEFLNGLTKRDEPEIIHTVDLPQTEFTIADTGLYSFNTRANLKIQDGCNHFCSFCIIPTVRGRARSREYGDIMREARELVASGHQELVLTGVNIGTYRQDGKTLVDIVRGLEEIKGLARIRISSIEPTTIGGALIKQMAQSEKLCHYLHIPLQSGDDTVLRSMRRKHTLRPLVKFIERTHELIPDIGFGTDIMAGYPGETDEQFQNTVDTLTNLPFFYFHVFTYSDRQGTHSDGLASKVPHHVKKERTRQLIKLSDRKRRAFYSEHLGEQVEVLFEQMEEGYWTGYTRNYMKIHVKSDRPLDNKIQDVKLTHLGGERLIGELVSDVRGADQMSFAV